MTSFYVIKFLKVIIDVELWRKQAYLSYIAMLQAFFEHTIYDFVLVQLTTSIDLPTKASDHLAIFLHDSLELSSTVEDGGFSKFKDTVI